MWRQFAGEQRQLFFSWIPQRILCLHALHLENLGDTWREGMNLRRVNARTGPFVYAISCLCVSSCTVCHPRLQSFAHSWFFVCLLSRSSSTSPQWICTGVTCVGTTMWKSEMDIGEKLHLKVCFNKRSRLFNFLLV